MTVIGSAGQQSERATLHKALKQRLQTYKYTVRCSRGAGGTLAGRVLSVATEKPGCLSVHYWQ